MKKILLLSAIIGLSLGVFAFEYQPKNVDSNPFGNKVKNNTKTEQAAKPEMREIKNLTEYFRYLPAEVHRHWTPYKANVDYEITVQFTVHRDGTISDLQIVGTNYPNANASVLNAVKSGAPYQPLPKSFNKDSVKAQIVLEYRSK
jgi:outer membrane biosynthesis protein TonB